MDMNNPNIKEAVEELVQDILAGKASAGASAELETIFGKASETIDSLKEEVSNLKSAAEENTAAVEGLEQEKSDLETELSALKEQIDNLNREKEELEERANKAEDALDNMAKDKAADERMAELSELKVARVDKEALKTQRELVKEMSDDEFAAYRDESVSFRNDVLASVEQESDEIKSDSEKDVEVENDSEEASEDVPGSAEDVDVPPADIEGALESASTVLPNADSDAKVEDWEGFSVALASLVKKGREDEPVDNK